MDVNRTSQLDSAQYLAKLENRLAKMKDRNKDPSSKEMLTSLQQAKDSLLNIQPNNESQSSSFLSEGFDGDKHLSTTYIARYLFPEKQALTVEEVQHLLHYDTLARTTAENADETNAVQTDKSLER